MKILIAGGGIGGLVAGLCLAEDGHQVEIFEQTSEFREIGAGVQLSPNCTRVLCSLGLESELETHGFMPRGTEIRHFRTGRLISRSILGGKTIEDYGFPYYHIHRGDLLKLLVSAAENKAGITLHLESRVEKFFESIDKVNLTVNKIDHSGDLLVGADGIRSTIREQLWGKQKPRFTGNIAWRAMVPVENLPDGMVRPMATVWWGPQRHFVHYYVKSGAFVNCVCVTEKRGWEIESWTEPGSYAELKADFKGWNANIQQLLESADKESFFKWALFDRPPMEAWGKGHVTLLGDACHPTLPFMAQGAAMAIEDAAVLAGCLRFCGEGQGEESVRTALLRYENLRKGRTARIQRGSRSNGRIFHFSGIRALARNLVARRASRSAMHELFSYNALEVANKAH